MRKNERLGVLLRLPPELKRAIVREVERRGSNMNDVVLCEIAAEYGVRFDPSTRRGHPSPDSCRILIRMSDPLKRRIQRHALANRSNLQDTLVRLLARRFGIVINIEVATRTTPFGGGRRRAA